MRSQPQGISLAENGLSANQVEELVRFVRTLDTHPDTKELISSLLSKLSGLVVSNTAALVLSNEIPLSGYVIGNRGVAAIQGSKRELWQDEVCQVILEQPQPFVASSLDQEIRFNEMVRFFRECGNQSLCVLPLHTALRRLGALCFAREPRNAFTQNESTFCP
jgi:formate hydrogenlyase transcriptional activator